MKKRQSFKIHLRPSPNEETTQLHLCGSVRVGLIPWGVEQLVKHLAQWSGRSVELVLPADVGTVEWFESIGDLVSDIPVHLLKIRFSTHGQYGPKQGHHVA